MHALDVLPASAALAAHGGTASCTPQSSTSVRQMGHVLPMACSAVEQGTQHQCLVHGSMCDASGGVRRPDDACDACALEAAPARLHANVRGAVLEATCHRLQARDACGRAERGGGRGCRVGVAISSRSPRGGGSGVRDAQCSSSRAGCFTTFPRTMRVRRYLRMVIMMAGRLHGCVLSLRESGGVARRGGSEAVASRGRGGRG